MIHRRTKRNIRILFYPRSGHRWPGGQSVRGTHSRQSYQDCQARPPDSTQVVSKTFTQTLESKDGIGA